MDSATAPTVPSSKRRRAYTLGEEIANSVTHGVGIVLSVIGLIVLVVSAVATRDALTTAVASIYGATLVIEYTASTLYHALPQPKAKYVFKVLDHAGIYLLIAGSYTPFTLLLVEGRLGTAMFVLVWVLAAIGISVEAFWVNRPGWLSAAVYLAMGWLAIVFVKPLVNSMPPEGVALLLGGGIAYTLGTPFYAVKRVPYLHMVWHIFVILGSVLHYFAVLLYAIPAR
jgi:hemolysin III